MTPNPTPDVSTPTPDVSTPTPDVSTQTPTTNVPTPTPSPELTPALLQVPKLASTISHSTKVGQHYLSKKQVSSKLVSGSV